jgi:PEP-CTERM/exosortase A-associated glycosyltransferase
MHIFHVFDHSLPLHSGYAFRSRSILLEQRALGWRTSQLTSPKHYMKGPSEEEVEEGLVFHRTPALSHFMAGLPVLNNWAVIKATETRLMELARGLRPDIIHAHSPALNGIAALAAGRRLGIPVVYEVRAFWEDAAVDHGTNHEGDLRYRLTRALETHVVKGCAATTVICEGLKNDIIARGIPESKITVIPNAVDIEQFPFVGKKEDDELIRRLGLEGKRVLGFIGSFYGYEGLDLLLEALPMINSERPDIRLLLVGGGPQEEALKQQVAALGLEERVIFMGRVPHGDVVRFYDVVDIFVYPRKSKRVTELVTPLKPLEAMARGRIVVASDVGGHREIIPTPRIGRLFRAGDPLALAGAVIKLISEQTDWESIRQEARQYVERNRTWSASVGRYRDVYQGVLEGAERQ